MTIGIDINLFGWHIGGIAIRLDHDTVKTMPGLPQPAKKTAGERFQRAWMIHKLSKP
jgi:hypothetical protein